MNLDPDFHCLSYGDVGERRRTKTAKLGRDDLFMRLGRTSTIEADLQRAWERGPIVLLQTKVTRELRKKIASLTSRKLSPKSLEARVGFEPSGMVKTCKLFILCFGRNCKIARNAEVRYTAGTRDPNQTGATMRPQQHRYSCFMLVYQKLELMRVPAYFPWLYLDGSLLSGYFVV